MTPATPTIRIALPLVGAIVGLLLLVVFGQFPTQHRWGPELADAAHGPAFAVLTVLLLPVVRCLGLGRLASLLLAASISVALGAAVEGLQWLLGRDVSMIDLRNDALGAAAATGALLALRPAAELSHASSTALRALALVVALAAASALLLPPIRLVAAYLERERSFPILVDFRHWTSTFFIDTYGEVRIEREVLPDDAREGARALHARLSKRRRWTIALYEPSPDWRARRTLTVEMVNPTDDPLAMDAWVRDRRQGTRGDAGFRLPFSVRPRSRETARLALPPASEAGGVDYAQVGSLFLIPRKANEAREFYVVRIGLE